MTGASPRSLRPRLDAWLWRARFFKTRGLAGNACAEGRIRVDGEIVRKAHRTVRVGQVLTIPKAGEVRVVRVESLGARRGPATEARALYSEIAPDGAGARGQKDRQSPDCSNA